MLQNPVPKCDLGILLKGDYTDMQKWGGESAQTPPPLTFSMRLTLVLKLEVERPGNRKLRTRPSFSAASEPLGMKCRRAVDAGVTNGAPVLVEICQISHWNQVAYLHICVAFL